MNTNWPFYLDHVNEYAYWEEAFTEKECNEIIKCAKKQKLEKALVRKPSETKDYRESNITWIFPENNSEWIFRRLTDIVTNLNERFFKFDLEGFAEGLQFTNYKAPHGRYDKHVDKGSDHKIRKLSLSVQLNKPEDYKEGELNLYFSNKPITISKKQGYLVLFPSYVLHEVKPVTKGERNSLVAWVTGKNFK